jgi:hypothetical protein
MVQDPPLALFVAVQVLALGICKMWPMINHVNDVIKTVV